VSVTVSRQQSPAEQIRQQLVAMTPEFRNALPSHIKPEKFQRVVMTAVQQTPDLMIADRRSLFASCTKCATDGLLPDGREAALVIFNTKVKREGKDVWIKAVQYMPMLAGLQKRARNSGDIAGIITQVVYEADEFVQQPDNFDAPIHHRPPPLGSSRGKVIGAYAMAKLKDGTIVSEVMDIDQINRVMAVSRSKDKDGNPYGPWKDWFPEMARKTVFRRLSKWLPTNSDVDDLIRRDDEIEAPAEASDALASVPATIDADEFESASSGAVIEQDATTQDAAA
jgi:recombination protein RecT